MRRVQSADNGRFRGNFCGAQKLWRFSEMAPYFDIDTIASVT
jgi:hypothetical protein